MLTTCYIHWGSCDCIMYSHDKDSLSRRRRKARSKSLWPAGHDARKRPSALPLAGQFIPCNGHRTLGARTMFCVYVLYMHILQSEHNIVNNM
uniref:Uncharacterized protein n=1 Tax=Aegilops tauschii subsp. strangulata TaxID=200361 RepID=A0A453SSJ5_AEGTS